MLVLSRKVDESIVVAGNITIMVCEIRPGFVRLGVSAPKDVTVDRQEVHQRKVAESVNQEAEPSWYMGSCVDPDEIVEFRMPSDKQEATDGPATDGPSL